MADLLCRIAAQGAYVTHKPHRKKDAVTITAKGLVALAGGFDEFYAENLLEQTVNVRCNLDEGFGFEAWNVKKKMLKEVKPKILGSILWAAHYGHLGKEFVNLGSASKLTEAMKFTVAWYEKVYGNADQMIQALKRNSNMANV